MQKEPNLDWMQELPKRVPIIRPIRSLIFGFMSFLIFLAFMLSGIDPKFYPKIDYIMQTFLSCTLLVYLLNYNIYLFNKTKTIVKHLNLISGSEKQLYDRIMTIFSDSKRFYIIVSLVIIYFLVINYKESLYFSNLLLNIYIVALSIFNLYLIALALSTILNISFILDVIGKTPFIDFIKIDPFNIDEIGGLGAVEDCIKKSILYYSIGISLAILSYFDPEYFRIIYEIIALGLLLMAGIILLIWALDNLQKPFRKRIIKDIDKINEEYLSLYVELTKIISDNKTEDDKALESITKRREVLQKEREERERMLKESKKKYSYSSAIAATIAFIIPIFTLFEKMNEFGIIKFILDAFNIK
jgi:hypothetical protein